MIARTSLLLCAVLLTGCHRYIPARPGTVPEGTEVRIHLSEQGAERVEELTGREARQLTGDLERWSDDVVISVPVPAAEGMLDRGLHHRVVVSADQVISVEIKQRDRTRTMALSAGVAAVVVGAAIAAFGGVFGGTRNPDPPVVEEVVVPLWLKVFP